MLLAISGRGATIPVYKTTDQLAGSLRQAIINSNAGDTIVFQIPTSDPGYDPATGVFTINLTTGHLFIGQNLTVDGGGQKIVVQRSPIAGTPNFRIFYIGAGAVVVSGLTIANGNDPADGLSGAGIRNSGGSLTLVNCTIANNKNGAFGGGIFNASGILTVNGCTFRGNTAHDGGGIRNQGTLTVNNSTFAGNIADNYDGGAIHHVGLALTLTNSTITGNTATLQGGGVWSNSTYPARVRSTIIAGNTSGVSSSDVLGSFISEGYNFIGIYNNQATGFGNAGSHDQVGTDASPANPGLGSLQDNGGPTHTRVPLLGSPVIDQGNRGADAGGQPINTDQRGYARPVDQSGVPNAPLGDGSDVGAVENDLPQPGPIFTVTSTSDSDDGVCSVKNCTLREAINASNAANANADANTINFAPGLRGTILNTIPVGLIIIHPLTINGPGARLLTLSGNSSARLFNVATGITATISGLTISDGLGVGGDGGAIFNRGGLTLVECTISNSVAFDDLGGGGVFNESGATLVLTRCTFNLNSTNRAVGAIYNLGALAATNCTFYANAALNGGAIISKANTGASSTTLRNCTITACFATDTNTGGGSGGGGVYAEGNNAQFHLGNTILAGNTSYGTNPDLRGNVTSDGHNFIGKIGFASGLTNGVNGDQVGSGAGITPNFAPTHQNNGGSTDTWAIVSPSGAINAGDGALAPATDQRGYVRFATSDIGAFEFGGSAPVLKIVSITLLANGHISLQGLGVPNSVHSIQAASDPDARSFLGIGTALSNGSGALQYDDSGAVGLIKRFYRLAFP